MTNKSNQEVLHVDERRNKILEILNKEGRVRVSELGVRFSISEVTIRSDLVELEKSGLLERTHGGAIPTTYSYYNMSFKERSNKNTDEKRVIASAVAAMVEDGQTIMINSGTTTHLIAHELRNHNNLKIVTNSLTIAQELGGLPSHSVILLGGDINAAYAFTYGSDAIAQLQKYRSDILILSIDGVSSVTGLSTYHYEEADIDRAMLRRVNKTIVVADFSKIGRECFSFVDDITSIDTIVTNASAPASEVESIREKNVDVITL